MRRYSLLFLFTLATAAWAQTPLDHAELPLARGKLLWSAGQGLTVLLDGQTVFRAPGSEFVLHDKAWTTQLFNSSKPTSAKLEQRGAQQVLTVVCANDKCQATQVITAGPGDHCEIAWRWTQDGWDDAALQLACGKPAESFFAGSAFEALVGQRTVSGTIPAVYSDKAAHPVSGAARLTVKSLFGTAVVTSTRPMTLYDYKQRHGAFWLGCDVPVPRGQEDRCTFTVDLAPPDLVLAGVRVTGVRFTDPIVDGQATVALKLAAAGGPRKVRLEAELRGVGQSVKGESAAELSEAAQDLEVRLQALTQGSGELVAVLKDAGDGRELVRLPVLPVTVQQALAVSASR